jgi:pre-RNA processing PIH1/Nop17.
MVQEHKQKNKINEFDISQSEVDQLISLMEKDRDGDFKELMKEYMHEISDPANREETEQLLKMLEEKNEVPHGKQLLRPQKGFVIKFKMKFSNNIMKQDCSNKSKYTKKNGMPAVKTKLFVNIVHSEKIGKPTSKKVGQGHKWFLPYSLSPLRMEYDKNKLLVPTFDCCFHPDTLELGTNRNVILNLIANTAGEGVKHQYKKMNEIIELDTSEYVVLRGIQYKNGNPVIMLIKSQSSTINSDCMMPAGSSSRRSINDDYTSIIAGSSRVNILNDSQSDDKIFLEEKQSNLRKSQENVSHLTRKSGSICSGRTPMNAKPITVRRGFLLTKNESEHDQNLTEVTSSTVTNYMEKRNEPLILIPLASTRKENGDCEQLEVRHDGTRTIYRNNHQLITPQFEIIEVGEMELNDYTINGIKQQCTRPKYLKYRIDLPGTSSVKHVTLDVSKNHFVLSSSKYYLYNSHPYPVVFNDGRAKFDAVASKLTVLLPVQQKLQNATAMDIFENQEDKSCKNIQKTNVRHHHTMTVNSTCNKLKKVDDIENVLPEMGFSQNTPHSNWLDKSSIFVLSENGDTTPSVQRSSLGRDYNEETQKLPILQVVASDKSGADEEDDRNLGQMKESHTIIDNSFLYSQQTEEKMSSVEKKYPCTNCITYTEDKKSVVKEEKDTTRDEFIAIDKDRFSHTYFNNTIIFDID